MAIDWQAFWLTLRLAITVSAILLVLGLPIACWIAYSRWRGKFLLKPFRRSQLLGQVLTLMDEPLMMTA